MGAKLPQYPPTVKTLPDGRPNPLYDPGRKPAPSPPLPPPKCAATAVATIRILWEQASGAQEL